jgi:murein DD-endopeptidase MepM/ murein hydrolase activator NlpD
MRTPVSGARISSSFGMRKHPILGYTRLHSGVDFAAGYGTPIKAAGNGVIDKAGRFGSYGKYVRIRHANGFGTAYAHMSRFASGIKAGKRIRQGQVIGYVGSTGRSTGPHLHYEVMVKGKQVNPMTVRMPTGRRLSDKMLTAFNREKATIDTMMQGAPSSTRVAAKQ